MKKKMILINFMNLLIKKKIKKNSQMNIIRNNKINSKMNIIINNLYIIQKIKISETKIKNPILINKIKKIINNN